MTDRRPLLVPPNPPPDTSLPLASMDATPPVVDPGRPVDAMTGTMRGRGM